eukprot:SAG11_NODE_344_length_10440_cov_10.595494_7_plen_96_part_00
MWDTCSSDSALSHTYTTADGTALDAEKVAARVDKRAATLRHAASTALPQRHQAIVSASWVGTEVTGVTQWVGGALVVMVVAVFCVIVALVLADLR